MGSDKLTLLRVVPGNRVLEQWFHSRFKNQRCHGEWFRYSPLMESIEIPDGLEADALKVRDCAFPVDIERRIFDLISDEYGHLRRASTRAAMDANSIPRTARNWLEGRNLPLSDSLIHLMASNDEFAGAILELVDEVRAAREELRR